MARKEDPGITHGAYFNVLRVPGLQDDFLKSAFDDESVRELQDIKLQGEKKMDKLKIDKWVYAH